MSQSDHHAPSPDAGGSVDRGPFGRPQALDDAKKEQICALVFAGCSRARAARYVGCTPKTIERSARRDPLFAERLERANVNREITELDKIRQATGRSWRASAWLVRHFTAQQRSPASEDRFTHKQLLHVVRWACEEIESCPQEKVLLGLDDPLKRVLEELSTPQGVRRRLKSE